MGTLAGIVSILGAVLPLVLEIFKEYFSAQARARAEEKAFKLDQEAIKQFIQSAWQKRLESMAKDSKGQGDAWDEAEKSVTSDKSSKRGQGYH